MRLTRLEIENFKCIGDRQIIPIRPITLFFGPNSAGKSTILQAAKFFNIVLNEANDDGDQSEEDANRWNFMTLSHNHIPDNIIKIKAGFNVNQENRFFYFELNDRYSLGLSNFEKLILDMLGNYDLSKLQVGYLEINNDYFRVTEAAVQIEVASNKEYDPKKNKYNWNLVGLEIDINNHWIFRIDLISSHVDINLNHSMLMSPSDIDMDDYQNYTKSISNVHVLDEQKESSSEVKKEYPKLETSIDSKNESDRHLLLDELSDLSAISGFSMESVKSTGIVRLKLYNFHINSLLDPDSQSPSFGLIDLPLNTQLNTDSVNSPIKQEMVFDQNEVFQNSPLKFTDKRFSDLLEENDENKEHSDFGRKWFRLEMLFSEMACGPTLLALYVTGIDEYPSLIGPLRPLPGRGAASRDIYTALPEELETINHWLEERFKLDYTVKRFHLKFAAVEQMYGVEDQLRVMDVEQRFLFDPSSFMPDIPEHCYVLVKLYNKKRNIYLDFEDVGVGISQLVPILSASLAENKFGYIAMQQPELHLHPAIQVVLGDLFIELAWKDENAHLESIFLVETHSEHLLLRLLRRIRETTKGCLPQNTKGLNAEDLSVIYVEPVRDKIRIKRLKVNDHGEFKDRWPNGFFDDRAEELF